MIFGEKPNKQFLKRRGLYMFDAIPEKLNESLLIRVSTPSTLVVY
jgi:hypothetical protein